MKVLLESAHSNLGPTIKSPEEGSQCFLPVLLDCLPVCKACISNEHMKVLPVLLPLSAYFSTLFLGSSSILPLFESEPQDTHPWLPRRWTVDSCIPQSTAPINQEKTPCSCFCWPTKHNFDALLLQDSLTLKGKEREGWKGKSSGRIYKPFYLA